MKQRTHKLLSMLLAMIMVMSLVPTSAFAATCPITGATGAGTEADPIIVDTFEEFKAALQFNGDLTVRVNQDIKENITIDNGYAAGDTAITIPAKTKKHLTLDATVDIKAVDKEGNMYSLIDVQGELILDGSGTLVGGFNANNFFNAILFIQSPGVVTINENPKLKVYSNISTYGRAIMNYTGKLTINGGSFEAENASSRNIPTYAVDVKSPFGTTINGGHFNVVGSKVTDADCGLKVQKDGKLTLNGGTSSGILSEAGKLSDLLGSGRKYYKDNKEFNAGGLNQTAETLTVLDHDPLIKNVAITNVTAPKAGQMPNETAFVSADAPYTVNGVGWYKGDTVEPQTGAFEENGIYWALVNVTPKSGYTFAEIAEFSATVNGNPAEYRNGDGTYVNIKYTFPPAEAAPAPTERTLISEIAATMQNNEAGKTPADVIITSNEKDKYTAGSLFQWKCASDGYVLIDNDHVFEAGKTYKANVWFKPSDKFFFNSDTTAQINDGDISTSFYSLSYEEDKQASSIAFNVEFTIPEAAPTTASYTVKHMQEKLDALGTYEEVTADTQTLTGNVGDNTAAAAKEYTGFTAKAVAQKEINADGKTVVEIEYDRNRAYIHFDGNGADGGTGSMDDMVLAYGESKKLPANTFTREGYKFAGWNEMVDGSGYMYSDQALQKHDNPYLENNYVITLYAQWEKDATPPTTASYTVKHMQEKLDGTYEEVKTETLTGNVGEMTKAAETEYPGFSLGGVSIEQKEITADGKTEVVIKYFRNTATIYFKPNYGTSSWYTQGFVYGQPKTTLMKNTFTRGGYKFIGWNDKEDGTGTSYQDEAVVDPSELCSAKFGVTNRGYFYYAQWEEIAPHTHTGTKVTGQAPTCTADGWKDYYKCDSCSLQLVL